MAPIPMSSLTSNNKTTRAIIESQRVRLIGKEATEIEQIDAGLIEAEGERRIVV
jgi:hypothetical protein